MASPDIATKDLTMQDTEMKVPKFDNICNFMHWINNEEELSQQK